MLKAILSKNFRSLTVGQILAVLGIWGHGFEKLTVLLRKDEAHLCLSLSSLSSKLVEDLVSKVSCEKNKESRGNEVLLLLRCLNYRSVCDACICVIILSQSVNDR